MRPLAPTTTTTSATSGTRGSYRRQGERPSPPEGGARAVPPPRVASPTTTTITTAFTDLQQRNNNNTSGRPARHQVLIVVDPEGGGGTDDDEYTEYTIHSNEEENPPPSSSSNQKRQPAATSRGIPNNSNNNNNNKPTTSSSRNSNSKTSRTSKNSRNNNNTDDEYEEITYKESEGYSYEEVTLEEEEEENEPVADLRHSTKLTNSTSRGLMPAARSQQNLPEGSQSKLQASQSQSFSSFRTDDDNSVALMQQVLQMQDQLPQGVWGGGNGGNSGAPPPQPHPPQQPQPQPRWQVHMGPPQPPIVPGMTTNNVQAVLADDDISSLPYPPSRAQQSLAQQSQLSQQQRWKDAVPTDSVTSTPTRDNYSSGNHPQQQQQQHPSSSYIPPQQQQQQQPYPYPPHMGTTSYVSIPPPQPHMTPTPSPLPHPNGSQEHHQFDADPSSYVHQHPPPPQPTSQRVPVSPAGVSPYRPAPSYPSGASPPPAAQIAGSSPIYNQYQTSPSQQQPPGHSPPRPVVVGGGGYTPQQQQQLYQQQQLMMQQQQQQQQMGYVTQPPPPPATSVVVLSNSNGENLSPVTQPTLLTSSLLWGGSDPNLQQQQQPPPLPLVDGNGEQPPAQAQAVAYRPSGGYAPHPPPTAVPLGHHQQPPGSPPADPDLEVASSGSNEDPVKSNTPNGGGGGTPEKAPLPLLVLSDHQHPPRPPPPAIRHTTTTHLPAPNGKRFSFCCLMMTCCCVAAVVVGGGVVVALYLIVGFDGLLDFAGGGNDDGADDGGANVTDTGRLGDNNVTASPTPAVVTPPSPSSPTTPSAGVQPNGPMDDPFLSTNFLTLVDDVSLSPASSSSSLGFGSSVALVSPVAAVGAPAAMDGNGEVVTFRRGGDLRSVGGGGPTSGTTVTTILDNPDSTRTNPAWTWAETITAVPGSRSFGADVDLVVVESSGSSTTAYMVVGAPEGDESDNGSVTSGAVYLYAADLESSTEDGEQEFEWELQSPVLVGSGTLAQEQERFGSAVRLSTSLRVVVGAPDNSFAAVRGGYVYVYQYEPESQDSNRRGLQEIPLEQIMGETPNGRFGSDVDITDDGSLIVIGEPGLQSCYLYEWTGFEYERIQHIRYQDAIEFGSSVVFLAPNLVAVGAPAAQGDRGAVYLFEASSASAAPLWIELQSLTGDRGDRLGTFGTISGRFNSETEIVELVVATAKGTVRRYDLANDGNGWILRLSVDQEAAVTAVAAWATEDEYHVLAGYGGANAARVYLFEEPSDSNTGSAPTGSSADEGTPSTSSPTSPPTTKSPTASPTYLPTLAPTETPEWDLVSGPFTAVSGSSAVVAISNGGEYWITGDADAATIGHVQVFEPQAGMPSSWTQVSEGRTVNANSHEFGFAVDLHDNAGQVNFVVGAPASLGTVPGFSASFPFGSASVYAYNPNSGVIQQVGSDLRPNPDVTESSGRFGASVALSQDGSRVAVGAPRSSLNQQNLVVGRVYTFEWDGSTWQQLTAEPLAGEAAFAAWGTSVAMNDDGSRLLVGAPGEGANGNGAIHYFRWDASQVSWEYILPLPGGNGEALGTSVAILTATGDQVAFGGPTFSGDAGSNQGVIRVFGQSSPLGPFVQLGPDLVGRPGERVGTTVCGAGNRIAYGTNTGLVYVQDYNANTASWEMVGGGSSVPIATGTSPVTSLGMSRDGTTLLVGLDNGQSRVYQLD